MPGRFYSSYTVVLGPLLQSGVHGDGGLVSHVRQRVGVDVKGQAHVAVTQELLDEVGIDSLPQEERRAGVAKIVKEEGTRQPCTLQEPLER